MINFLALGLYLFRFSKGLVDIVYLTLHTKSDSTVKLPQFMAERRSWHCTPKISQWDLQVEPWLNDKLIFNGWFLAIFLFRLNTTTYKVKQYSTVNLTEFKAELRSWYIILGIACQKSPSGILQVEPQFK